MSLQFKKPQKKNFRQRFDEDGEHDETMEVDDATSALSNKKEKKKKKKEADKPKTKQTLLSFDDLNEEEDDGEIFQVKKSSQSKKLMRQLDKERKKRREVDKGPSQNSNNGNVAPVIVKQEPVSPKTQFKQEKILILNGREAEFAQQKSDTDEDEDQDEVPRFNRPKHLKQVLESGAIPDAAMIHAARKSRQKARDLGGDYIPIDENKSNENSRSRLSQDGSDEEGEGEEEANENQRIDFTVDTSAKEQEKRREAFFAAQDDVVGSQESDQEDDELENWEAQQIRKAVTGAQLAAAQQEVLQHQAISTGHLRHHASRGQIKQFAGQPVKLASIALQIKAEPVADQVLAQMPIKIEAPTIDELTRLLRERLSTLKETQRRHVHDRERVAGELEEIQKDGEKIQECELERSNRFQFYQDLRGYVTDLVECFNEKMPMLEQLELRFVAVLSRRSSQLIQRRRQDIKDQAAEAAALTRPIGSAVEQDEARVRRAAEREGRRSRRRRARESSISDTVLVRHFEGISSDDEQAEVEVSSLKAQLDQIERDAYILFEDVVDEFSNLDNVMHKFEEWKKFDFDSYKEAYVHLALPKVFSPLIRLSLITWNPLEENCPNLESNKWFQSLALFGLSQNETEEMLKSDPDVNLIPLVIEMGVLPKLAKLVVDVWDPCSSTQTQRLLLLLRHILTEYPMLASRGRVSKSLLPALTDKLRESIDNDVFIPIYPARPAAALGFFFQRQFWASVKLLRNVLLFRAILGDGTLQDLAMTALLGRYLLAALRTCEPLDALEKSRHILATIPRAWLQKEPQLIQLQMFATQVTNIVKAVDVSNPGGREAMMEALAILKSLGARTKAEELGKIYL